MYLGFGLTQVDEINFGTTTYVVYPTQPILSLLMPWRLKSPGHQQAWLTPQSLNIPSPASEELISSSTTQNAHVKLHHFLWYRICYYMCVKLEIIIHLIYCNIWIEIKWVMKSVHVFDPLALGDIIWCHWPLSPLVQLMAWCSMAPSHYQE